MKLLLINPHYETQFMTALPPCNLLYIAQAARSAGHEAEILDLPRLISKEGPDVGTERIWLADKIFSREFDIVGIGGIVTAYKECEDLVRTIKKGAPDIPIIIGGSVGLPLKELWQEHAPVEFLCEGDGEILIKRFLDCMEKNPEDLKKIPGLHWLNNEGEYCGNKPELPRNLDYIPFPTFDEIDIDFYTDSMRRWLKESLRIKCYFPRKDDAVFPINMSRGCPCHCAFCYHFDSNYRYHSPAYIADWVQFMIERYHATGFLVCDDSIFVSKKWLHAVCDEMIQRDIDTSFYTLGARADLVDRSILEKMKRAGYRWVSYGIESGSQKILDLMKKKTTVEDNLRAIATTKEVGLEIGATLLFGIPGENDETLNETRDFMIRANLEKCDWYIAFATPFPGSELFREVFEKGLIQDIREYLCDLGSYMNYRYNLTGMPGEHFMREVRRSLTDADIQIHLRRRNYPKALKMLLAKHLKGIYHFLVPTRLHPSVRAFQKKLCRQM